LKKCLPNVFQPQQEVDVIYRHWSLVEASLTCLRDLRNRTWNYVINLCAHDYPLKTNLQIVRQLQALNGLNSMESTPFTDVKKVRVEKKLESVSKRRVRFIGQKDPIAVSWRSVLRECILYSDKRGSRFHF